MICEGRAQLQHWARASRRRKHRLTGETSLSPPPAHLRYLFLLLVGARGVVVVVLIVTPPATRSSRSASPVTPASTPRAAAAPPPDPRRDRAASEAERSKRRVQESIRLPLHNVSRSSSRAAAASSRSTSGLYSCNHVSARCAHHARSRARCGCCAFSSSQRPIQGSRAHLEPPRRPLCQLHPPIQRPLRARCSPRCSKLLRSLTSSCRTPPRAPAVPVLQDGA